MRILFTGVRSFAGRRFFELLQQSGQEVIGISSETSKFGCKVNLSQPGISNRLPTGYFDALIHFASHVPLNEKTSIWSDCAPTNVYGTNELLRALEGRVGRVLLASSCAIYGEHKLFQPVTEDHPLRPDTAYALSKYAQELMLQAYCRRDNLAYAIMRLGYVYGPGLNPQRILIKFLQSLLNGDEIRLTNARGTGLHLIHVDDIAAIGVGLLNTNADICDGSIYNVVAAGHLSLLEFIETAALVIGKPAHVIEVDNGEYLNKTNHYANYKLCSTGMAPKKSLDDGIRSLLEHFKF